MTIRSLVFALVLAALVGGSAGCGDDDVGPTDGGATGLDAAMSLDASVPSGDSSMPRDADPMSSPDAATVGVEITGTITSLDGTTVPAGSRAIVIWSVSAGSPDYSYKLGEGPATATSFTVSIPSPPPAEALNGMGANTLGVAYVLVVPPGLTVPDGRVVPADFRDAGVPIGISRRSAVIWRTGSLTVSWADAFPEATYSCGMCMTSMAGFDSYVPASCTALVVYVGDSSSIEGCNWT